jgi:glycosyltransferase involved in cell wall biosynthesis
MMETFSPREILIASPFAVWPAKFGGAVRTAALAAALSRLGHRVTLLCMRGPSAPPPPFSLVYYASRGRFGHFLNLSYRRTLNKLLGKGTFDLVIQSFPFQSFMTVPIARRHGMPLVYDAHNVEADRFRMMGSPLLAHLVAAAEGYLCRHATACLAVSANDQALLRQVYDRESLLLPNGLDLETFTPAIADPVLQQQLGCTGAKVIAFFGALSYGPNLQAVRILVENVLPAVLRRHPSAKLLVIGPNPPPWLQPSRHVIVTGSVEHIPRYLALADVVAVPLAAGGGTRLKIIEALGCGKRVVATPFAAMGLPADATSHVKLADAEDFAAALCETLDVVPPTEIAMEIHDSVRCLDWSALIAKIDWATLARKPLATFPI